MSAEPREYPDSIKRSIYRKDPVSFVRKELKETPSKDQKIMLRDFADLEKRYFIITAGRGAGKTMLASWLVAWSVACLADLYGGYPCTILGGSGKQSKLLNKYFKGYIYRTQLLQSRVKGIPGKWHTDFMDGTAVDALAASEESVRGPHVELLILDEAAVGDQEVMESALGQISGMKHGRIVILSTPHKPAGFFREMWDEAEAKGFGRYGPWPLTNCPWIRAGFIEDARRYYSPNKFKADILGEFTKAKGAVLEPAWVDDAMSDETFDPDTEYKTDAGVDWGFVESDTVSLMVQYRGKDLYVCSPMLLLEHVDYPEQIEQISELGYTHHVDTFSCDSSHKGENQRLEAQGFNVLEMKFGSVKAQLVEVLTMLFYKRRIHISKDLKVLEQQLRKFSRTETRTGRLSFSKKDSDAADTLLCAIYPLFMDGEFETATEGEKFVEAG